MMKKIVFYLFIIVLASCSGSNNDPITGGNPDGGGSNGGGSNGGDPQDNSWSIPVNEVKDGGPGKDGIPSIDNPKFINANEAPSFLKDSLLVVGIVKNNIARAYPHEILDWHEIVNDDLDGEFITLNFCPLTGTAFGWESKSNDEKSTFGVSGLLYNANLILYDRNTGSNWSQLKLECVNGDLIGDKPELISVIETTWGTWKTLYPDTKILSTATGFDRDYGNSSSPYGDYRWNHNRFIFPPAFVNSALPNKERVHAIIDGDNSKVYQFHHFTNGKAITEVYNGWKYLIVGNENLIYSYKLVGEHTDLLFEYDFNSSEGVFFKDNEGNKWSVIGEAIEGSRTGEKLLASKSVISYWFAIAVFYPTPEIYTE